MAEFTEAVRVVVPFKVRTAKGLFSDALTFTEREFSALSEGQISIMKAERANAWVALVSAPPKPRTRPQIQAELDAANAEKVRVEALIVDLTKELQGA